MPVRSRQSVLQPNSFVVVACGKATKVVPLDDSSSFLMPELIRCPLSTVLSPNTRLALSFALLFFAYGGLKASDYLQEHPEEIPQLK